MQTSLGHVGLIVLPLLVYVALLGTAGAVTGRLTLPVDMLFVNGVAALTAVLVVLASYRWFGARRSSRGHGLKIDGRWLREVGVGSAIGLTAVALPFLIGLAGGWLQLADVLDPGEMGLWTGIALILLANCCVGLWEELMLRGVFLRTAADGLQRWLSHRQALLGGLLVSATVFGFAHAGQPAEPAFILTWVLAGLVFGAVAIRSGNLALPIGAHAAFNVAYQACLSAPISTASAPCPLCPGSMSTLPSRLWGSVGCSKHPRSPSLRSSRSPTLLTGPSPEEGRSTMSSSLPTSPGRLEYPEFVSGFVRADQGRSRTRTSTRHDRPLGRWLQRWSPSMNRAVPAATQR